MRWFSWLLAIAAALVLLGLSATVLTTAPTDASHSWGPYHWYRTSNPFTLKLHDHMSSAWDPILVGVSTDWTTSTVLDTPIDSTNTGETTPKRCRPTAGRVEVCNAFYGYNGWLGLATIWIDSNNHIVQGTAKVNDAYFSLSTYNDPNAKRHVLCQEVGHTLGLGHQTAVSCMDDRNGLFDSAYVSPNAHDYEQLVAIYSSHTDASSGSGTPTGDQSGRTGPGDAVPAGAGPEDGNVFVLDLGGGRLIITFVTWAEPGAAGAR